MSTQLRELFETAADSQPPDDLAVRALAAARSRRRQRYTVVGSALAAAAVVLGVVVASGDLRTDSEPRPTDVASLPEMLPAPDGLPTLAAGTMDAASAAYIVDGEVVVIDAATGDGASIDFASMGLTFLGRLAGVTDRASLALSPDGRFLALTPGLSARTEDGTDALMLVDVETGEIAPQSSFSMSPIVSSGREGGELAWSPDGQSLACICVAYRWTPRPALYLIDTSGVDDGDFGLDGAEAYDVLPRQISWGIDGLVGQFAGVKGEWRLVPQQGMARANPARWEPLNPSSFGRWSPETVVMGQEEAGGLLAWMGSSFTVYGEDSSFTSSTHPRLYSGSSGQNGYIVVVGSRADDPAIDPTVSLEVEVIRDDGTKESPAGAFRLTTLPPGATTASFASDLVG